MLRCPGKNSFIKAIFLWLYLRGQGEERGERMPGTCGSQSHEKGFTHQQLQSQRVTLLPETSFQSQKGAGDKCFNLSLHLLGWLFSQTPSKTREQRTLADVRRGPTSRSQNRVALETDGGRWWGRITSIPVCESWLLYSLCEIRQMTSVVWIILSTMDYCELIKLILTLRD